MSKLCHLIYFLGKCAEQKYYILFYSIFFICVQKDALTHTHTHIHVFEAHSSHKIILAGPQSQEPLGYLHKIDIYAFIFVLSGLIF